MTGPVRRAREVRWAIGRGVSRLRREGRIIRAWQPELGTRGVLVERVRTHLGMDGVDARVATTTWEHGAALAALERKTEALEQTLRIVAETAAHARTLATFDSTERSLACRFDADETLISVVLPTLDRGPYLRRAIASVLGQLHENWELLVVDAGGRPATAEVLADFGDPRIRMMQGPGMQSGAARNVGLEEARGELVAYLDDDNVMLPWWLRAVALAAQARPDTTMFYGARVIEQLPGEEAWWQFEPFTRSAMAERNLTDTNVIAHRHDPEVRWPFEGAFSPDWEFVAGRVAVGHEPLAVPVRAVLYTTSAPGRASDVPGMEDKTQRARSAMQRLL